MSYLYNRSNFFWRLLIRFRLTAAVWRPLIEVARRRHLQFRKKLALQECPRNQSVGALVSAGV